MSRIGKQPIAVPNGVTITVDPGAVKIKGPKGTLAAAVSPLVELKLEGATLHVARREDSRDARSVHGLTRKLVANVVTGVSEGFRRVLEINGVGYRAESKGNALQLALGYSHPILFQLPKGVTAKIERQVVITLESADREQLGQVAAQIRELRPPEPYKGKGIKYAEERIRRKAGKAAGAGR